MAIKTKIQWATATWNPFIGCTKVSPACDNCYAERWAKRAGRDFSKVARSSSVTFHSPLAWKEPQRIFVCSLSDFFHADILRADRHAAIKIMRQAPQHIYMLLTKRPENIKSQLAGTAWADGLPANVWVGVTVEDQQQAEKRIPILLRVPAQVRFLSCEPLLGPIDLWSAIYERKPGTFTSAFAWGKDGVQWVIVGGESGAKARSDMQATWVRALRDQCAAAEVPFMFKQWGEWNGGVRMGKDKAGRLLDGVEYNGVPEVRRCRVCGCTEDHACLGGCSWVKADLCSACVK